MTQYKSLNVNLSNSQLNILKSGIKNNTEITLKISSSVLVVGDSANDFPQRLLLTNTQVSKLRKAFANVSSANTKLSKTQLHKIGQSGGLLGRLLGPFLKAGLPLIGNVFKTLAKNVLIPLGLTVAAAATDPAIHKKMFGSGLPSGLASRTTILIISSEEMNHIIKIIKSLEESDLLIKDISETVKNEAKEQKGRFLGMLFGTLGASLLGNLLTGKGAIATSQGRERLQTLATRASMPGRNTIRAGEGTVRAGQDF